VSEDRSVFDLTAQPSNELLRYGQFPDQLIERFGNQSEKKVALIHGGYWRPEYDRVHLRPFAVALAESGINVFLIEYRREPGNPDATLEDISAAIELIGECSLIGHSAGGHLALLAEKLAQVQSVIALAPVSDLAKGEARNLDEGAIQFFLGAPAGEREDLDPARIGSFSKPVIIIHGDNDLRVPVELSRDFAKKFLEIQYLELPSIGHFELIDPRCRYFQETLLPLL